MSDDTTKCVVCGAARIHECKLPGNPEPCGPFVQATTTGCPAHCDHLLKTFASLPPIEVWQCCHCGRKREVRHAVTGGSWAQGKHGPYAPDLTPYFGNSR